MPFKQRVKQAGLAVLRQFSDLMRSRRQPDCILVLQYMVPLGGCVHATPLFQVLHEELPELPAVVATHGTGLQVLRHDPNIHMLLDTPDALRAFVKSGRTLQKLLRQHGLTPAWVLTDLSNPRSRIALLNTVFLHRRLAGFSLACGLQHVSLHRDSERSLLANNLRLAETIAGPVSHREPRVYTSPAASEQAGSLLRDANPRGQVVAVFSTQSSGGQPSEWHTDRVQSLATAMVQRGVLPVFVGTAEQSRAVDELRRGIPGMTASLAGKTNIPVLAALLALSDLCISIDTGTMHVARSSGVPMVVLAPTYQDPVEWLPLEIPHIRVLRGEGTASVPESYRLDEITVDEAIGAVEDLLKRYPPSERSREMRLAAILSDVDHLA